MWADAPAARARLGSRRIDLDFLKRRRGRIGAVEEGSREHPRRGERCVQMEGDVVVLREIQSDPCTGDRARYRHVAERTRAILRVTAKLFRFSSMVQCPTIALARVPGHSAPGTLTSQG